MSGAKVGVLGAGAWGTALAQMLASDGREVLLWAREPELVEEINARRTNSLFLPSATLGETIRATGDLADAASCEVLLAVTPAQHLGAILAGLPHAPRSPLRSSAARYPPRCPSSRGRDRAARGAGRRARRRGAAPA